MPKLKWEIKSLDSDLTFKQAGRKVISKRIKILESVIEKYLKDETPENLHEVRIAIRRLRYNMEIFISCFTRRIFLTFYKVVADLQDITGKIRDNDVLISNLKSQNITNSNNAAAKSIENSNIKLKNDLIISLKNFLDGKEFKDFIKLLK